MSIESIYSLQEEVTGLVVAGSRSGIDNSRLKRYREIFQKAGERSKIFVTLQRSIDALLASTEAESPEALGRLLTITSALLTVLSKSEVEEELKSVEPIDKPAKSSGLTYNQIDDIATAKKNKIYNLKKTIILERAKGTFDRRDPRLFKLLKGALGSEAATALSSQCRDIYYAKYMALNFEIADSNSSRANFRYIAATLNEDLSDIARDILSSRAKSLYILAVRALGSNVGNREQLIEYTESRNKSVAKEALLSLVRVSTDSEQTLIEYAKDRNRDVVKEALQGLVKIESKEVKPIIRAFISKGKLDVVGDAIIALNDIGLAEELCDYINAEKALWKAAEIDKRDGTLVLIEDVKEIKLKIRTVVRASATLAHFHSDKVESTISDLMFGNAYFISLLKSESELLLKKLNPDYCSFIMFFDDWDNIEYIKDRQNLPLLFTLYKMRECELYYNLISEFAIFAFRESLSIKIYRENLSRAIDGNVWYQYFTLGWILSTHVVIRGTESLYDDCIGYIEELGTGNIIALEELLYRAYRLDSRFTDTEITIDTRFLPLLLEDTEDIYEVLGEWYPRLMHKEIEYEDKTVFQELLDIEKQNFFDSVDYWRRSKAGKSKVYGCSSYINISSYVRSLLRTKFPGVEVEIWVMDLILEVMKHKRIAVVEAVKDLYEYNPEVINRFIEDPKYSEIKSRFGKYNTIEQ